MRGDAGRRTRRRPRAGHRGGGGSGCRRRGGDEVDVALVGERRRSNWGSRAARAPAAAASGPTCSRGRSSPSGPSQQSRIRVRVTGVGGSGIGRQLGVERQDARARGPAGRRGSWSGRDRPSRPLRNRSVGRGRRASRRAAIRLRFAARASACWSGKPQPIITRSTASGSASSRSGENSTSSAPSASSASSVSGK